MRAHVRLRHVWPSVTVFRFQASKPPFPCRVRGTPRLMARSWKSASPNQCLSATASTMLHSSAGRRKKHGSCVREVSFLCTSGMARRRGSRLVRGLQTLALHGFPLARERRIATMAPSVLRIRQRPLRQRLHRRTRLCRKHPWRQRNSHRPVMLGRRRQHVRSRVRRRIPDRRGDPSNTAFSCAPSCRAVPGNTGSFRRSRRSA
jgi:hypothetical protein